MRAIVCAFAIGCISPPKSPITSNRVSDAPHIGAITGRVTGRFSEPAAGATVVATPLRERDAADYRALCDDAGAYTLDHIPPGTYSLAVYYFDDTEVPHGIAVVNGAVTRVDLPFDRPLRFHAEPLLVP